MMQGSQLSFDFSMCVLSEYDDDGHLGVAIDHYGEEKASGGMAEAIFPFGILARPLDPDTEADTSPTSGCGMLMVSEGSSTSAMPLIDPRVIALLPKLRKGGQMSYCGAGCYAMFDGLDPTDSTKRAGSYYVGVKYKSGSTKRSHGLHLVCRNDGSEYVSLTHGYGQSVLMTASGSAILKNKSGNAYFEACDAGLNIAGDVSAQGAWRVGEPSSAESLVLADRLLAALAAWEKLIIAGVVAGGGALAPFIGTVQGIGTKQLLAT